MNSEAALMFLTLMLMTIQELWDVVQMVKSYGLSETSVGILLGQDCAKFKSALIWNTEVVVRVAMQLKKELPQEKESDQNAQFHRLGPAKRR